MNAHSSRSHTVFTVTVHLKESSVDGNIDQFGRKYISINFINDDSYLPKDFFHHFLVTDLSIISLLISNYQILFNHFLLIVNVF